MIKKIIKEIGIAIMLLIAIALILSIIFYEYIPNNKAVPIQVKPYTLSEDMQEELKESINQEENIVTTLYIDDQDLNKYESSKDYNKGKANPFADYSQDENNTNNTTNNTANENKPSTNTSTSNKDKTENEVQNEVYVSTPGKN